MEEKCSIGTILNLNCNICGNRKNFKIDVEDLSLLEYWLLKILKLWKMCASTTKPNLSLSFQIITEDVKTLLEVIKML